MRKWKILETQTIFKNQWFDVKEDRVQISEDLAIEGVLVMSFSDWVNVVALTPKREVILEKQYRHGMGIISIETPSGSVEESDASPKFTAEREMFEETGYSAKKLVSLGKSQANPQLMNNYVHHFLALECEPGDGPQLQWGEEIEVWTEPFEEALRKVRSGEISHSITVEGLLRAHDWMQQNPNKLAPAK